ncbi:predicted protein [Scheffersomyces stipitis CBS 6054]|uniref:Uncharacterized protein n=1 Tax=Scheffersomyces stipitis (strain ATCC 58785 / CBS 6054 / NBRC 10063 / NRRL Y-11545) TaxID=322104 RepID=A3M0I4_PICST|nr:predicted protein [Scheffersomyces stipitis CBS 6054]ABN68710.2 predicted protein [Scheffersomyces stipitis CBS 6054]
MFRRAICRSVYRDNIFLKPTDFFRMSTTSNAWKPRYFDIGVNFSDSSFQGRYHDSTIANDPTVISAVIDRAHFFNVEKILITSSTIKESEDHFGLCEENHRNFSSTAGVHPCTVAEEFYVKDENGKYTETLRDDVDEKLQKLKDIVETGHELGYIKAFGEIGLDYDRLHYSTVDQQKTMFRKQLEVIADLKGLKIPLFLHMRAACDDFVEILQPFIEDGSIEKGNGVVHSFTGTEEELSKLLKLGFYISLNGCSLKTEENLQVASLIPKEKLLIETDAPWCEVRKTHAGYKYITPYPNKFYPEKSMKIITELTPQPKKDPIKMHELLPYPIVNKKNSDKHFTFVKELISQEHNLSNIDFRVGKFAPPLMKSRNEPVFVGTIAEILCGLHGITDDKEIEDFVDLVYENSCKLFKV